MWEGMKTISCLGIITVEDRRKAFQAEGRACAEMRKRLGVLKAGGK